MSEVIDTFERDGWNITVTLEPDYDYQPGRDDDIYPRFEEYPRTGIDSIEIDCPKCEGEGELKDGRRTDGWRECEKCEGTGRIPDPDVLVIDFRHGQMIVTGEEVARLIEIGWGEKVSDADRAKAREQIASDAQAIGHENLSWVGVVVTASRGTISGSDSLWGIEYDLRESDPEKYSREVVEDHGMVESAIEEAARQALGGFATQALSY